MSETYRVVEDTYASGEKKYVIQVRGLWGLFWCDCWRCKSKAIAEQEIAEMTLVGRKVV